MFLVTHLAFSRVFAHRVGAAPLNRFWSVQSVRLKWFSSFCSWLNLYYSRWKIVKLVFELSNAESRCWHQAPLFLLLPILISKLQLQFNFLILNLPSRHVPFKSVYNRAVGRCYELHCDKALCKPSLSVWLWSLVACVFLCFVSSPFITLHFHLRLQSGFGVRMQWLFVFLGPGLFWFQGVLSFWTYLCLLELLFWPRHRRQILF